MKRYQLKKVFGLNLKNLLASKNIKQRVLSEFLGVTSQCVSGYINAKTLPEQETIDKIATFLDVTTDYLLTKHDDETNVKVETTGFEFNICPDRLYTLRKDNNLSLKEVAFALKINDSMVRGWEKGQNPTGLVKAVKLSNFFGISLDYLVGRTDDKQESNYFVCAENYLLEILSLGDKLEYENQKMISTDSSINLLKRFRKEKLSNYCSVK